MRILSVRILENFEKATCGKRFLMLHSYWYRETALMRVIVS